ncbi:MAG: pilus assembly protein PilM [Candidatus Eremiobacterota bacterium]
MSSCIYCGKEITSESVFCQFCGYNNIPLTLEPGVLLHSGRYEIIQTLETGGMAILYIARDHNLDTLCTIKIMTDNFKDPEERAYAISKFKDEAVILAKLRHPGLPVVQNHFVEDIRYCLVMDYVKGKSLEDILYDALLNDYYLSPELVINWGIQICDILDYLHTYKPMIIHRDVKPDNLMEHEDNHVVLVDFGVAHVFEKRDPGTSVGTTGYASPEQYLGKAYPQSDIFALGATLHRLLTGYDPSEAEGNLFIYPSLNKYRDDMPSGLQEIISKATEMEAENRFSSAKEFKEALLKIKVADTQVKPEESVKKTSAPVSEKPLLSDIFKIKTSNLNQFKQQLSKVIGLDIGSHEIKLLQMGVDSKGHMGPKLISCKKTPDNTVSNGMIINPKKLSETIKSMLKDKENFDVIASLSPYCSVIRTIKVPVTSADKLPSLLSSSLKQIIPLPVEECYIDYKILPSHNNDRDMKVRIIALVKKAYDNLKETLFLANLKPDNVIIEPFAMTVLANLIIKDEIKRKNVAIINMGDEGTSLTLMKDGQLSQTTVFPYGGHKLTEAIMQAEMVDYEHAEELKKIKYDNIKDINNTKTNFFHLLILHVKDWATGISKALRYFGSDYRLDKFDSIIFCGGAIQFRELHKYINTQLKINSYKFCLPKNKKTSVNKQQFILDKETALMSCMGLIISSFKDLKEIHEVVSLNNFELFKLYDRPAQEKVLPGEDDKKSSSFGTDIEKSSDEPDNLPVGEIEDIQEDIIEKIEIDEKPEISEEEERELEEEKSIKSMRPRTTHYMYMCHACNSINRFSAKFCTYCGEDLVKLRRLSLPRVISEQSGSILKCPRCNTHNNLHAKFCKSCGVTFIEMASFCLTCNTINRITAKFCNTCGGNVRKVLGLGLFKQLPSIATEYRECPECKNKNRVFAKFCKTCRYEFVTPGSENSQIPFITQEITSKELTEELDLIKDMEELSEDNLNV